MPSIISPLRRYLNRYAVDPVEENIADPYAFVERMKANKAYYDSERLYEKIRFGLTRDSATEEQIDNLRSPAFRAVEFHVGHIFPGTLPGALPIESTSKLTQRGRKAVADVWKASNFSSKKQAFVRSGCWSGNGFLRVPSRASDKHPYFQVIEPQYVREFEVDERGHLTYYRSSTPTARGRGQQKKVVWVTEVFEKEQQRYRVWEKPMPLDEYEKEGGAREASFSRWGIDFIPIVWAPFMESSPGMGTGVFEPFKDRIDNVNRAATRLHDMLFRYNRSVWALERSNLTPEGYEMPPAQFEGSYGTIGTNLSDEDYYTRFGTTRSQRLPDGTRNLGDDPMTSLPSGVTLRSLVPSVDYTSALAIVNSDLDDLATDMPELLYTKALESAARDSSKVLVIQLAGAVDRAREARGNFEAAIIRASQMAITIGDAAGIDAFSGLGAYEDGSLDFEFEDRPVIPLDPAEKAQEQQAQAAALDVTVAVFRSMGLSIEPLKSEAARIAGVDEGDLQEMGDSSAEGEEASGTTEGTQSALQSLLGEASSALTANGQGQGGTPENTASRT